MLEGYNLGLCTVSLEGVTVEVGGRAILKNLSLTINGGLTAFIGPNGAGKTTLLRVVAGVVKPSRGRVRICSLEPGRARRLISYVPAFLQVDPYARVEDVLRAYAYGLSDGLNPREALRVFNLLHLEGRRFNSLSGGEHKLVLIAGALARKPRVLLLDEPFSHLDIANQTRVARILREATARGVTIVMTVHEPLYASLADNIGVLSSGELVAFGAPREVMRRDLLEKVYGVKLEEVRVGSRNLFIPEISW